MVLINTVFEKPSGYLNFYRFLCSSFPQIVPMLTFALITTFLISFSPVGETHSTGSAYIAPSRPFFAMKLWLCSSTLVISLAWRKIASVTDLLTLKVLSPKPGEAKFLFRQVFVQTPSFKGYLGLSSLEFSVIKMTSSYTLLF